jgi:hypothetical protein
MSGNKYKITTTAKTYVRYKHRGPMGWMMSNCPTEAAAIPKRTIRTYRVFLSKGLSATDSVVVVSANEFAQKKLDNACGESGTTDGQQGKAACLTVCNEADCLPYHNGQCHTP